MSGEVRRVEYGNILKAIRIKAGLSQEDLASLLNRSRSCISKIESNKKIIDLSTFMQWVEVTKAQEIAIVMMFGVDSIAIIQDLLPHILPVITGGFIAWLGIF